MRILYTSMLINPQISLGREKSKLESREIRAKKIKRACEMERSKQMQITHHERVHDEAVVLEGIESKRWKAYRRPKVWKEKMNTFARLQRQEQRIWQEGMRAELKVWKALLVEMEIEPQRKPTGLGFTISSLATH